MGTDEEQTTFLFHCPGAVPLRGQIPGSEGGRQARRRDTATDSTEESNCAELTSAAAHNMLVILFAIHSFSSSAFLQQLS
jgi:hypothetical protein